MANITICDCCHKNVGVNYELRDDPRYSGHNGPRLQLCQDCCHYYPKLKEAGNCLQRMFERQMAEAFQAWKVYVNGRTN